MSSARGRAVKESRSTSLSFSSSSNSTIPSSLLSRDTSSCSRFFSSFSSFALRSRYRWQIPDKNAALFFTLLRISASAKRSRMSRASASENSRSFASVCPSKSAREHLPSANSPCSRASTAAASPVGSALTDSARASLDSSLLSSSASASAGLRAASRLCPNITIAISRSSSSWSTYFCIFFFFAFCPRFPTCCCCCCCSISHSPSSTASP
mmetsp:Transcript_3165/g.5935  ORF Transcript_3165/g.5935 Transcript_3165/m.5935 type:complete len:211 (+) Transcript_3165:339-971(+)